MDTEEPSQLGDAPVATLEPLQKWAARGRNVTHPLTKAIHEGPLEMDQMRQWAQEKCPGAQVVHVDMRSNERSQRLADKGFATRVNMELRKDLPNLIVVILRLAEGEISSLHNLIMSKVPGELKGGAVYVYDAGTLHPPAPHAQMAPDIYYRPEKGKAPHIPFLWGNPDPDWWDQLDTLPIHPSRESRYHVPDVTHPLVYEVPVGQPFARGAGTGPPLITLDVPQYAFELPPPTAATRANMIELGYCIVRRAVDKGICNDLFNLTEQNFIENRDRDFGVLPNTHTLAEHLADLPGSY